MPNLTLVNNQSHTIERRLNRKLSVSVKIGEGHVIFRKADGIGEGIKLREGENKTWNDITIYAVFEFKAESDNFNFTYDMSY